MSAAMPEGRATHRNSTADRALDILALFTAERTSITAADVAEQVDVARSTAYRYLQSLVASRFLEESGAGRYRLGPRVLELARVARGGLGLSDVARPVMRRLSDGVGETVILTRRTGDHVICLDREETTSQPVRISYEPGQLLPSNAGASAYVLLAWLSEKELAGFFASTDLRALTSKTLTTEATLRARLQQTAERGFAVSRGELDTNVLGIAAPIYAPSGDVVAAVSVAAFSRRVPDDRVDSVAEDVRGAAREITDALIVGT